MRGAQILIYLESKLTEFADGLDVDDVKKES